MESLKEILKEFDKKRTEKVNAKKWNEDAVAECFENCARQILCNGYFLINGKYIIDLGAIELYYHEEEGEIKDYIMYHIKDKIKSKIKNFENELPYFKFGSFNLHQSGVDVTFENIEKKYRASFLIRSYRVLKTEDGLYPENDNTQYDPCSTHIFDDMFYSGYGDTEIVWIPTDRKKGTVEQCPRVHVAEYLKDNEGKYVMDKNGEYIKKEVTDEISPDDYDQEKKEAQKDKRCPIYFKIYSKIYKQDMRKWQFRLNK
jgi:hypothetical protein